MIFFNIPSVGHLKPDTFFGNDDHYGFISTLFSKKYDTKKIKAECALYYKKKDEKYWGQIITLVNACGIKRFDKSYKMLNIPLIDFIAEEYIKKNIEPSKQLFNFYLHNWQYPHPILTTTRKIKHKELGLISKNPRYDYPIIKPFSIVLNILLELKNINRDQAFLKNDEFYWLGYRYFNSSKKFNILDYINVAKEIYKMRLGGGWKKFLLIKHKKKTKSHLSYPRAFFLNSLLLVEDHVIFNQKKNEFFIGLNLNYDDKVIKKEIILSDKNKFTFNPKIKPRDENLITKFSHYMNDIKAFENWKKETLLFNNSSYNFKKFDKNISSSHGVIANQLEKLSILDKESKQKSRTEQHILRNYLFGASKPSQCCICEKNLPLNLLRAAHIQKRSKLNDKQKRDINVVMPACTLGCDSLFENGYIFINKGIIKFNTKKNTTPDLTNEIKKIKGSRCGFWNSNNKEYFELHEKTHT